MALAGVGNPVGGSNPAGTGQSLNYLGNHVYMYTGTVSVPTSETTIAEFTTGSTSYIVGAWQPMIMEVTTDDIAFKLYFNDQLIAGFVIGAAKDYTPWEEIELIVPGDTIVKITGHSQGASARDCGAIFTGRVYA